MLCFASHSYFHEPGAVAVCRARAREFVFVLASLCWHISASSSLRLAIYPTNNIHLRLQPRISNLSSLGVNMATVVSNLMSHTSKKLIMYQQNLPPLTELADAMEENRGSFAVGDLKMIALFADKAIRMFKTDQSGKRVQDWVDGHA